MTGIFFILLLVTAILAPLFIRYCRNRNINRFWPVVGRAVIVYVGVAYLVGLFFSVVDLQEPWYMAFAYAGYLAVYGMILFSFFFIPFIGFLGYYISKKAKGQVAETHNDK